MGVMVARGRVRMTWFTVRWTVRSIRIRLLPRGNWSDILVISRRSNDGRFLSIDSIGNTILAIVGSVIRRERGRID